MNLFQAAFLGILQGLTEFIPVSSTAHLVIVPWFFAWKSPREIQVAFDVFLHFGTLLALVWFYWRDIVKILRGFFLSLRDLVNGKPFKDILEAEPFEKLGWLIVIGSGPAAVMGFFFKEYFEQLFENVLGTAVFLLLTGILLVAAERKKNASKELKEISVLDSLLIGVAQGFAIAPGISRSGATIATGLFRQLSREAAPRFAFLLSVPAIFGATVFKFKDFWQVRSVAVITGAFLISTLAAAVSGYIAIKIVLKVVQRGKLRLFAYYCFAFGLFTIFLWLIRK